MVRRVFYDDNDYATIGEHFYFQENIEMAAGLEQMRWLAEKKEEEPLDYTVLSVGVMTLGLILFVEFMRHWLDRKAEHRPFFKTVLETTYSECKFRLHN